MKSFNTLFIVFFIFFALLITSDVNSQESAVTSPKVAVVNFQKLVIESNIGKKYLKSARANVENKQKILSKLEDQVRSMRDKYDEQKLVLDEKARDEKGEDLAYKITELRRKREDFEADIKIQDSKFQRDIMRAAMKSVKVVSEQLGYDFVISAQAPGLMYLNPSLDITDKVLEQMNN
ncbi:MAG: OmpH family outer membrane protein [Thermodesulfobacteriota bacterium]|nr:OmpH family outer membrane protein [bacterium]MEC7925224.1 OmpH family outer membrane protein [Thermodesulfobacteriota bacterium]|tara:strand:+ start:14 stop:547 length:534 start_codon:yes stop_codon:yes gene_type:complete